MSCTRAPIGSIVALALSACGTGPDPERYLIYDRRPSDGEYHLVVSEIETLTVPRTGEGELATIYGGGELAVSLSAGLGEEELSEEAYMDALSISGAGAADIDFDVDAEGTAIPWDFDSAMMLSLYHHLERGFGFFGELGVDAETIGVMPVYYGAGLGLGLPVMPDLVTDNAAYVVTLDAFWIPPSLILDDVPLVANTGVVIHELSHAVFNRIVHEDRRVPRHLLDDWPTLPVNEITALDEGVADYLAAVAVDDPNFVGRSVAEEIFDVDRDLREVRVYDGDLAASVAFDDVLTYNPYALGSVIAGALWTVRSADGIEGAALDAAVIAALGAIAGPSGDFRITQFVNAVLAELPAAAMPAACEILTARLEVVARELACP